MPRQPIQSRPPLPQNNSSDSPTFGPCTSRCAQRIGRPWNPRRQDPDVSGAHARDPIGKAPNPTTATALNPLARISNGILNHRDRFAPPSNATETLTLDRPAPKDVLNDAPVAWVDLGDRGAPVDLGGLEALAPVLWTIHGRPLWWSWTGMC